MTILGIETSCDETSAAIVQNGTTILSEVTASSLEMHRQYGGIVPEVSSRMQAEYIIPVLTEAFEQAGIEKGSVDAIAVTYGPGLMGPLLVGVETAKVLSYVWKKPLVPVNHLIGHIYSAWLMEDSEPPQFPALAVIVSGGHTELILMNDHDDYELIGQTRDDAAGEAFDKVARTIGLPYPGGPEIQKIAEHGNAKAFAFPRPMLDKPGFEFSFSGLKTAVIYEVKKMSEEEIKEKQANIAASFQQAVIDVIVGKAIKAAQEYRVKSVLVTGGVSANKPLRESMAKAIGEISSPDRHPEGNEVTEGSRLQEVQLHLPPIALAMDNATYIAAAAHFNFDKWKLYPNDGNDLEKIFELEPDSGLRIA